MYLVYRVRMNVFFTVEGNRESDCRCPMAFTVRFHLNNRGTVTSLHSVLFSF